MIFLATLLEFLLCFRQPTQCGCPLGVEDIRVNQAGCLERCRDVIIDLVVADDRLGDDCVRLREALRMDGPPAIVVSLDSGERAAMSVANLHERASWVV